MPAISGRCTRSHASRPCTAPPGPTRDSAAIASGKNAILWILARVRSLAFRETESWSTRSSQGAGRPARRIGMKGADVDISRRSVARTTSGGRREHRRASLARSGIGRSFAISGSAGWGRVPTSLSAEVDACGWQRIAQMPRSAQMVAQAGLYGRHVGRWDARIVDRWLQDRTGLWSPAAGSRSVRDRVSQEYVVRLRESSTAICPPSEV